MPSSPSRLVFLCHVLSRHHVLSADAENDLSSETVVSSCFHRMCHFQQTLNRSARPWPASQNRCGSQGNDIAHDERSSLNAAAGWRHFSRWCRVAIPAPAGSFLLPFCCRDFAATNGIRRNCGGRRGLPVAMISDSYEPTCRPHSVFSDPRNGAVPGASTTTSWSM